MLKMNLNPSEKEGSFDENDEMGSIVKNIYTSCDPDNTDCVPVGNLIEFIRPYMIQDLDALEDLKLALDPELKNVSVSSRKFYEVMSEWSKKVKNTSDDDSEFNRTPSQLGIIDDKDLPYTQSTPRASFGDKLLKNKDLLNLSNVSTYSLSKLDNSSVDTDKIMLEETVKKLEHQLTKVSSEMELLRVQLAAAEEQNETLQSDLERVSRRLHGEQQVIEHLQRDKTYSEDLKEDLNSFKKLVNDLKKRLSQSEKDSQHLKDGIKKTEEEKESYEKKYEQIHQKHQEARKEIIDLRAELDLKEQDIAALQSANDGFRAKYVEQTELCNHLKDENEILSHKKIALEALRSNRSTGFQPAELNLGVNVASNSGSEEELFVGFPHGMAAGEQGGAQYESLKSEMYKADEQNSCYDQIIFEKDERIFELEDEVSRLQNDIQTLQEIKSKLEPEIENCKQKIKELEQAQTDLVESNFVLTGNIECSNTKINSLKDKLLSAEKEINHLIDENNNKDEAIKMFKEHICKNNEQILTDLDTHMKKNVELESQLLNVNIELTKLKTSHQTKEKEVKDLMQKNSTQVLLMAGVSKKLKDAEAKLEAAFKDLARKNDMLEEKETTIREFEKKIKEINSQHEIKVQEVECNLTEIQEDLKAKSTKIDEITIELMTKEVSLKQREQEITDLRDKVNELTRDCKSKDDQYSKLHSKLDDFTQQLAQKSVDLLEANKRKETLQMANKTNELKIKELEEKVNSYYNENLDLRNTLKSAENELKQAQQKMIYSDNIEATMAQVQLHIDNKNAVVTELHQLNISLYAKVCQVQEELKNKISEVLDLREQLKNDIDIKNELWKDLHNLKREVDIMKQKNEELINKEQELFNDNEHFNQEHNLLLNLYDNEVIKNGKLNTQISELIEQRNGFKEKLENEIKEKQDFKIQLMTLTKQHEDLEHNLEQQKLNNFELTEKITSLETECDKLVKKLDESKKSFELLKANSVPVETHKSLLEKLDDKVRVNESLINKIKELNEENTTLLSKYSEQITVTGQLTQKIFNHKEEYNILQSKHSELNDKMDQLVDQIDKLHKEKEELSDELKESRESSENQSDSCSVSSEVPKSKSFLKQQITIERLKEKLDHVEVQLALEKSRRTELFKSKNELEERITDSVNRIEVLTNSNENLNLKLSAKQTRIENLLEENKQMENLLENSDEHVLKLNADIKKTELQLQNVKAEVSKKDELIESLQLRISGLEAELENNLTELSRKDSKLQSLTLKLKESEEKYQITYTNCVEKEHKIIGLETEYKKMQEVVSKSDDLKKRELMDIEEKISTSRHKLELGEFSLKLLKQNIEDSKKEYSLMTQAENKIKRVVVDGRNELQRITRIVFDEWKKYFEFEQEEQLLNLINDFHKTSIQTSSRFEEQVGLLDTQIGITKFLLECLVSTSAKMEALSVEQSDKTESNFSSESKRLNKFTLKAPTLHISRPVSPDSPSVDVEVDGAACSKNLFDGGDETQSFQQEVISTEPSFQLANLSLIDTLFDNLEHIELDESNNLKTPLGKSELEPFFTALAVQLSVTGKYIKDRLETQKEYYSTKQDKFSVLMMDITSRLRDHICIGTNEPIKPVFVLLEELKMLVNELMQVTGQLGVLSLEQHMRKPWSMVINYVALLRQENEFLSNSSRLESTSSSASGLRNRKTQDRKDENVPKSLAQQKARGLRSPKLTVTVFMMFVLFVGCVIMHWNCRANATSNQDCPLDFFMTKSRVGPPPL